jgi:hypothetical protein
MYALSMIVASDQIWQEKNMLSRVLDVHWLRILEGIFHIDLVWSFTVVLYEGDEIFVPFRGKYEGWFQPVLEYYLYTVVEIP